jgi:hypothetical protein
VATLVFQMGAEGGGGILQGMQPQIPERGRVLGGETADKDGKSGYRHGAQL